MKKIEWKITFKTQLNMAGMLWVYLIWAIRCYVKILLWWKLIQLHFIQLNFTCFISWWCILNKCQDQIIKAWKLVTFFISLRWADQAWLQGPISRWFFHRNSNLMEIPFYSHSNCSQVIAMKFCVWHDSCTVMKCAKFDSDMIPDNGLALKPIFYKIWITMEKLFMKWSTDLLVCRWRDHSVSTYLNQK